MSDGIYVILAGLIVLALWAFFISIREDRQEAKKLKKKEDRLGKIEQALKIWAQSDKDAAEALRKAGVL